MHGLPPLNALRAFEAAARHLSLTRAADELSVTPGAVSHQIRALEALLGVELFERRVRAVALTAAGKLLYPGLQTGFAQLREAVAGLQRMANQRALVISTPPGLTSKWLAPRLYRFTSAYPEIDPRISSSSANANFTTDGVDVAVRHMSADAPPNPTLETEKLLALSFVPVCSPKLIEMRGPLNTPALLAQAPLIHEEVHARVTWAEWFRAAGIPEVDVSRGLRFNSSDHALDAAGEGAGVLLAHDILAYDDLRTKRLVIPVPLALPSFRAYYLVYPKRASNHPPIQAFRRWIKEELAAVDWNQVAPERLSPPQPGSRRRESRGVRSGRRSPHARHRKPGR